MTTNSESLARFIAAQDGGTQARPGVTAYENACIELRAGRKVSHWIWFVFPQGPFGTSEMSRLYAIKDWDEALAYRENSLLRSRILEALTAVLHHITSGASLETLMGSTVDTQKLISCLTLFELVAEHSDDSELLRITRTILDCAHQGQWTRCGNTLAWLGICS